MSKNSAFILFEKERNPFMEYMKAVEQFEYQEHETGKHSSESSKHS